MTMANKLSPGQRMIASAKQALAFAEGEDNGCVVHIPEEIDVARIRGKVSMSQRRFAAHFGVSVRTIQEWEQGRAVPSGPARALLIVIDREPNAVRRALLKDKDTILDSFCEKQPHASPGRVGGASSR
jgi:putative transcriptional regulator